MGRGRGVFRGSSAGASTKGVSPDDAAGGPATVEVLLTGSMGSRSVLDSFIPVVEEVSTSGGVGRRITGRGRGGLAAAGDSGLTSPTTGVSTVGSGAGGVTISVTSSEADVVSVVVAAGAGRLNTGLGRGGLGTGALACASGTESGTGSGMAEALVGAISSGFSGLSLTTGRLITGRGRGSLEAVVSGSGLV